MMNKNSGCGPADTETRERKCIPCEIGAFCRNHYYRGKLLTERDFLDEQRYAADKARLHNLALHGWGIVCGLEVLPHPRCPELRYLVNAGLAIDCCGREIRVLKQIELNWPSPPPKKTEQPCPDDGPRESYAKPEPKADYQGQNPEPRHEPHDDEQHDDEQHPDPYNPCDDSPEPYDLYLAIRYVECETEFSPAPFDDCNCNSHGEQPNRVCEGYEIKAFPEKPKFWDDAIGEECDRDDCWEIYENVPCPAPCDSPWLPLALIPNFTPGQRPGNIDNGQRRRIASTATLDNVLRCVLEKLPTKELTRIVAISWEHGARVLCHYFMSEYVGSEKNPKGFEIRFDSKVYSRAINTRSFQALVIYRPDNLAEPRHMELAPVHIELDADQTEWCRLRIDPGYARRHLDGRNFDLFITLKCNVITGKNGLAVDGNFLATQENDDVYRMAFPTGDNIAGGTFESWIRVRPRPKGA